MPYAQTGIAAPTPSRCSTKISKHSFLVDASTACDGQLLENALRMDDVHFQVGPSKPASCSAKPLLPVAAEVHKQNRAA